MIFEQSFWWGGYRKQILFDIKSLNLKFAKT